MLKRNHKTLVTKLWGKEINKVFEDAKEIHANVMHYIASTEINVGKKKCETVMLRIGF